MKNKEKTKIEQCFELFLGNDDYRPVFNSPIDYGDYVVATNAYSLIFCEKTKIDFEFQNEEKNPEINMDEWLVENSFIIIPYTKDYFEVFKTVNKFEKVGKDVTCSACDGFGEVEWNFEKYYKDFECPKCHGDGLEVKAKAIETDEKTFDSKSIVNCYSVFFDMKEFYKLFLLKDILNDQLSIVNLKLGQNFIVFKIGIFKVVIMKKALNDDDIKEQDYKLIDLI